MTHPNNPKAAKKCIRLACEIQSTGGDIDAVDPTTIDKNYTIPGTSITIKLSDRDRCYLANFGATHKELKKQIEPVTLWGCSIKVHSKIARRLQERFDALMAAAATSTVIADWKTHPTTYKSGSCKLIAGGGAYMKDGHKTDKGIVRADGDKYGIPDPQEFDDDQGGIALTAAAYYIRKKKGKSIKNFISPGDHAFGLAFDIDYTHNPKPPEVAKYPIPQEAVDIIEKGGAFKQQSDDPAHFAYKGAPCN